MSYTIDQFGFEAIEQIPVKENDWTKLIETFAESEANVIKKEFDGKQASNVAASIRKAADALDAKVEVVVMDGTVYIQKA